MARWQPDARERLEHAALDLFTEQGFAGTTVPEITERAGLTTRTFFRHFADKREVLFADEDELLRGMGDLVAGAPPSLGPMGLLVTGLDTVAATWFQDRRDHLRRWRAVVDSDDGLRERSLQKMSTLGEHLARALVLRGVDPLTADLTARTGVTVLNVATTRWLASDDGRPLTDHVHETLGALRAVVQEG